MTFSIQPILENEQITLLPFRESDFEELYAVASDPKIWEQHPNKDRWQKEIFRNFFNGAIQSKGAFKIVDKSTGKRSGAHVTMTITKRKTTYSSAIRFTLFLVGEKVLILQ